MSDTPAKAGSGDVVRAKRTRPKRTLGARTILARGEPQLWLTGGSLVLCLTMIVGLLGWIVGNGVPTFWPSVVHRLELGGGRSVMGEVRREEAYAPALDALAKLDPAARARAETHARDHDGSWSRTLLRTGNVELTGTHFEWVPAHTIETRDEPADVVVIERQKWGRFYGFPKAFVFTTPVLADRPPDEITLEAAAADAARISATLKPRDGARLAWLIERFIGGQARLALIDPATRQERDYVRAVAEVWEGPEEAWRRYHESMPEVETLRAQVARKRAVDIARVNDRLEGARLRLRKAILTEKPSQAWLTAFETLRQAKAEPETRDVAAAEARLRAVEAELGAPSAELGAVIADVESIEGEAAAQFARLTAEIDAIESEARRPMLWLATATTGVEQGIALNDIVLAHQPNKLGTFGKLGVFVSRWWEFLSGNPRNANEEGGIFPAIFGTVLMTLIMCFLVVPFGVLAALYLREYAKGGAVVTLVRIAINNLAGVPSIVFGVFGLGFFCYIVGGSIDEIFFSAHSTPTFGKGGLMWASLTLALMTAPVVIVATEEALAAVPNSMREGSYACGASKWQTIRRIVLPRAMPGILTGAILAMARGAGEVAPLMLVGAVKYADKLPISASPPFGTDQSFMHLGYHIFDLGFHSTNSEASKPVVYTTTVLLIATIATLNIVAIWLRSRLRRKFVSSAF
ncbi:MAG: phosphate ABC transporter permease PstA [Planctomycetota bacterium]